MVLVAESAGTWLFEQQRTNAWNATEATGSQAGDQSWSMEVENGG